MPTLDPHQRPPERIRNVYKKYQKMNSQDLRHDPEIVDLERHLPAYLRGKLRVVDEWDPRRLTATFRRFGGDNAGLDALPSSIPVYEHADVPGSSFFSLSPSSLETVANPLDPSVHRPLDISQLLNKKMRWMTLGGQYDWTEKRYPDHAPPSFPSDVKELLEDIFGETKAEAAIVNLYSPGDTLSVHRDVAESSDTGLISVSLGCDAIFVIGTSLESRPTSDDTTSDAPPVSTEERVLAIRLRSGSAVYMSGASRFAWHGVPQIVSDTCPEYLEHWPAGENMGENEYEEWRGWMKRKRINVNVRQMWD
ncbi:hypothetical protein N0V90_004326 [Kalmusia sp. IMI 367209]|nr:hypothetical protein N0V90_004326 [Kalmusia sp. IMI 367209]